MMAAQASQQMKKEQEGKQPPDPSTVMAMDIQQHADAAQLKHQEADTKAQTEAFKATLKYETDMKKIEAQKQIADERNAIDLEIADIKQSKTKGE
jgi:hypothetical protein